MATNQLTSISRPYVPGVLDIEYHNGRMQRRALRYRLARRTEEVLRAIRLHYCGTPHSLLDIGTADALMLDRIKQRHFNCTCVGIDYSAVLLATNQNPNISLVPHHGDSDRLRMGRSVSYPAFHRHVQSYRPHHNYQNQSDQVLAVSDAQRLPIAARTFDVAVYAAVIEQLPQPRVMLAEAHRVLRPGGVLAVTTPHPFWERVAVLVGHEAAEEHCTEFHLAQLADLFQAVGFEVLEMRRFMLSPIGLPAEMQVEALVRFMRFNFLFANQLIVGRKHREDLSLT